MNTPILLDEFLLRKLNIEWLDGKPQDEAMYSLGFHFDVKSNSENKNNFLLSLSVNFIPVDNQYGLKVETIIDGFFTLSEEFTTPGKKEYTLLVNGATILYGILRGQVAMISGSFPKGKMKLPTVMMVDEVKKFFDTKQQVETLDKKKKTKNVTTPVKKSIKNKLL